MDTNEINILLFGQNLTGKSTLINCIANFLRYETAEAARHSRELLALIPGKFNIMDEDGTVHGVQHGGQEEPNEVFKDGYSSTQSCRSYVFPVGDFRFRIIDTPGLRGYRHLADDQRKCGHIVEFASRFKRIHGVWITWDHYDANAIHFEYFLKMAVHMLHPSASCNFFFICKQRDSYEQLVTSGIQRDAQSVNEIHGGYPAHKLTVAPERVFFLSQHAVWLRLAANKNGVRLPERLLTDADVKWVKTSVDCRKLLELTAKTVPHDLRDTHSMYGVDSNDLKKYHINETQFRVKITTKYIQRLLEAMKLN